MEKTFGILKSGFISALILRLFNPSRKIVIKIYTSDYALRAILSQKSPNEKFYPVAFYSQKLTPVEINYKIHNKKLLVIIKAFKKWHHDFKGAKYKIEVFTDHQNLKYFTTAKILNRRQTR